MTVVRSLLAVAGLMLAGLLTPAAAYPNRPITIF